jgi:hypothetical protein
MDCSGSGQDGETQGHGSNRVSRRAKPLRPQMPQILSWTHHEGTVVGVKIKTEPDEVQNDDNDNDGFESWGVKLKLQTSDEDQDLYTFKSIEEHYEHLAL